MTDKELMQQALEALEEGMTSKEWRELVKALRERLAQPEQELVCVCGAIWGGQELVSTPPPRQWQGLTKKEFLAAVDGLEDLEDCWVAIEAKLKEKNG